jgi:UDP-N-acetylmuramate: L-alanyl-gamma-D-glutamyl-meso-diaminopimelate ligase
LQISAVNKIYMMGIGGIAMGTLASMLIEKGYRVTGSDQNLYPPMSTHLEALGIPVSQGYRAENLARYSPDIVIVGNVIRRDNPEARAVLHNGVPYLSMPEAIARFFLSHQESIVVAGTHGKSTTSSLLAWVLSHAGMSPSAFIGAFVNNWHASYHLGSGSYMVIEGDEYDTAFFDKGPKFLHYQPQLGVITSIEYDHADIFRDFESVLKAFSDFANLIPANGHLVVNADDPHCLTLSRQCRGRVFTYGTSARADWRLLETEYLPGAVRFKYLNPLSETREEIFSRLPGRHNLGNTLAAMAVAGIVGLSRQQFQEALQTFQGVKRRQDIVGEVNGVLVIDDFAHHPTAVRETLRGLHLFYPGRRLIAAFEPRTNSSRRAVFQSAYAEAFDDADCICIKEPPGLDTIPPPERLNTRQLVADITKRGKEAFFFENTDDLSGFLNGYCASGDMVVCMSNGSFDGLPQKLLHALDFDPRRHTQKHQEGSGTKIS